MELFNQLNIKSFRSIIIQGWWQGKSCLVSSGGGYKVGRFVNQLTDINFPCQEWKFILLSSRFSVLFIINDIYNYWWNDFWEKLYLRIKWHEISIVYQLNISVIEYRLQSESTFVIFILFYWLFLDFYIIFFICGIIKRKAKEGRQPDWKLFF